MLASACRCQCVHTASTIKIAPNNDRALKCDLLISNFVSLHFQSRSQTAVHLVSSRQTGTATNILRALLAAAGKDIRLKADGVSASQDYLCMCVGVCV